MPAAVHRLRTVHGCTNEDPCFPSEVQRKRCTTFSCCLRLTSDENQGGSVVLEMRRLLVRARGSVEATKLEWVAEVSWPGLILACQIEQTSGRERTSNMTNGMEMAKTRKSRTTEVSAEATEGVVGSRPVFCVLQIKGKWLTGLNAIIQQQKEIGFLDTPKLAFPSISHCRYIPCYDQRHTSPKIIHNQSSSNEANLVSSPGLDT